MPVMDGDGQEVEFMGSGFVTDADADMQYMVVMCVAMSGVTENARHFRRRSTMPCRFIEQMKRSQRLTIPSEHDPILPIPSSYFVSSITCAT